MGDGAFPSLFAPLSASEFLSRHWRRRPLFTGGAGWSSKLRFTTEEFRRELANLPNVKAQFLSRGRHRETAIAGSQAQDLFDAGMSICAAGIERRHPALAEFAERIRDETRFAGDVCVNAYWSPAGGGFGTHFDEQHVFILQVEGSKRWAISTETGCEAPPENLVYSPEGAAAFRARYPELRIEPPDEGSFVEHELLPGDCLYLPPGTWHRTRAGDFSFALTLTLSCVRLGELLSIVARRHLERMLPWREVLPVGASPVPGLEPGWRSFLDARIAELRNFADSLTPEALAEEWLAATLGDAPPGAREEEPELADRDVLHRRVRLEICPSRDDAGDGVVTLLWAGGRCEIPGAFEPFCRRLAAATRFTPEEARRWTDEDEPLDAGETRAVLRRLAGAGLLRRA